MSLAAPPPWVKIPLLEKLLTDLELDWELRQVMLDEIDRPLSLKNQARPWGNPIRRDLVERYKIPLVDGEPDPFSANVIADIEGTLVESDGIHRDQARIEKGRSKVPIWAYVYKPPDEIYFRAVTDWCNSTLNGETDSHNDRVAKAMNAVARGVSREDAAKQFGITKGALSLGIRRHNEQERFFKLGVTDGLLEGLSESAIVEMAAIAHDDVLKLVFQTAKKVGVKKTAEALREGNEKATDVERANEQKRLLNELVEKKAVKALIPKQRRLKGEQPLSASLRLAEETIKKVLALDELDEYQEATLARIKDLLC